ncbi:unnamed protein product [Adineta ricciae]|uniref:Uncharacterized protein n=1 Tax=Adineta ricciae TaxID=249248 RepID=A0A815UGW2_ADIRI|nr:unnamed protein product [Adineta ricciae]CAF1666076.1 unnamed protein product [Adineta ricciae]
MVLSSDRSPVLHSRISIQQSEIAKLAVLQSLRRLNLQIVTRMMWSRGAGFMTALICEPSRHVSGIIAGDPKPYEERKKILPASPIGLCFDMKDGNLNSVEV